MYGPFDSPAPGDLPLPQAPLIRVLAQVRFAPFTQFSANEEAVASRFADAMGQDYPLFAESHQLQIVISPKGVEPSPGPSKLWRLTSQDETWRLSYATDFLSIETSAYTRRSEFAARLGQAWKSFTSVAQPPVIQRVGVRYVNRVDDGELLAVLPEILRPEIVGVAHMAQTSDLVRCTSEAHWDFGDKSGLTARWGLLPPGTQMDLDIDPAPTRSWILDLDSFREVDSGPESLALETMAAGLSLKAYQFFRWAVTPKFLEAFG